MIDVVVWHENAAGESVWSLCVALEGLRREIVASAFFENEQRCSDC
jgi:hypothetical protein